LALHFFRAFLASFWAEKSDIRRFDRGYTAFWSTSSTKMHSWGCCH
jgi:hypothetical protein